MSIKSAYVRGARAVRGGLSQTGAMPVLDRWSTRSRAGSWARSLLAIYDVEELADLDVPWWTFDSAASVDAFLAGRRSARVFEWGSGASTLWLARRSAQVLTVEHDPQWADQVRRLLPALSPAAVRTVPGVPATGAPGEIRSAKSGARDLDFRAYVEAIDQTAIGQAAIGRAGALFDLIVIDGRAREACLARARDHLVGDGMIVVDNVERARYRSAIAEHVADLRVVDWSWGLTPGLPYPTRTAVLRPVR